MQGQNMEVEDFTEGTLYLCATPIGNLQDITLRVISCLKSADLIAAENPEHTKKLLHYFGIKAPLTSYREANREKKSRLIINRLKEGARVALLSDAGTPGISDPGFYLIRMLIEENIPYTVLPGASAVLAALVSAAYPGVKFVFWGFLNRKKNLRRKELEAISREDKTVVLYESPHRLSDTLEEMAEAIGSREIVLCRELTKKFEEVKRGSASHLLEHLRRFPPRGEITLVVSPSKPAEEDTAALRDVARQAIYQAIKSGAAPAEAARETAAILPLSKKEVYSLMLEMLKDNDLLIMN